jgi:hypothetical protein
MGRLVLTRLLLRYEQRYEMKGSIRWDDHRLRRGVEIFVPKEQGGWLCLDVV